MPDAIDMLNVALARHRDGDLAGAEQACRDILTRQPDHVRALKMLGVLARDAGRVDQALDFLLQAIEHAGSDPKLYFHLGKTYAAAGASDDALRAYRLCLTLDEANAEAHHALGLLLSRQGLRQPAIEHFRRAVELEPARADVRFSLAATLADDGQAAAAEQAYAQLLERTPGHAQAWSNLGALVQEQGRVDEAVQRYRRAIAADPQCVEAWFNLGAAATQRKQFADAAAAYERVVQLRPDLAEAHDRLGEALAASGLLPAARKCLQQALSLRPARLISALRAATIGEQIFLDNAEIDAYRGRLAERLHELNDRRWQLDPAELPVPGSQPPAALAYHGRDDKPLKQLFARLFVGRLPRVELPRRSGQPRVGFVVTAGHEGVFLRGMAGMLDHLASGSLQVTLACGPQAGPKLDAMLRNPGIARLTLPADLRQAAAALQAGAFDLLYFWEVGTDALNYFLPFLRAAPVQCASWGWPVTSGIPELDLFISSRQLEPADAAAHYSEQLVQLEQIPNFYRRPQLDGLTADRSRFGFAAGEHLYLCPQNPRKFHPDFDPIVGEILRRDPAGVFLSLEASPGFLTDQLRARFERTLGDVRERIRFVPRLGKSDYLRLLASADVVLDTPHYCGGANTTYDVLSLGQPLVTLAGAFHRGRYAAAACRRIGAGELVAVDAQQYARIAVQLGTDADCRRAWSDRIQASAGQLFEPLAAVRELQEFFLETIARSRAA